MRISGTPTVTLRVAFSKPKANLSAALVSYPATGTTGGVILTRGWKDPENRTSDYTSDADHPGHVLQPEVRHAGQGRDRARRAPSGADGVLERPQLHIRPAAGTQLTLDLGGSSFTMPVVGGQSALAAATGTAFGDAGGTVPATLALTWAPRRVRRRSRRAWRRTTRLHDGDRDLDRG